MKLYSKQYKLMAEGAYKSVVYSFHPSRVFYEPLTKVETLVKAGLISATDPQRPGVSNWWGLTLKGQAVFAFWKDCGFTRPSHQFRTVLDEMGNPPPDTIPDFFVGDADQLVTAVIKRHSFPTYTIKKGCPVYFADNLPGCQFWATPTEGFVTPWSGEVINYMQVVGVPFSVDEVK